MYAVKFDTLEARESFREFCEFAGWGFDMLYGSDGAWYVQTEDTSNDGKQMNYLHDLGAFKWAKE